MSFVIQNAHTARKGDSVEQRLPRGTPWERKQHCISWQEQALRQAYFQPCVHTLEPLRSGQERFGGADSLRLHMHYLRSGGPERTESHLVLWRHSLLEKGREKRAKSMLLFEDTKLQSLNK